jgi:hypothetical protein
MALSLTFHGINQRAFDQLGRIVEHGVGAVRNNDTFEHEGVTVRYAYDAGKQDLNVEIIERPPIISDAYVVGWIVQSLASIGVH